MKTNRLLAIACLTLAAGSAARADLLSTDKLSLTGAFRLRAEIDRDSQDAAGLQREDRTRMRVRARLGLRFSPDDHWRFEMRRQGNGFRDHSVLELSLQARWRAGGRDLSLGGDLMHNFEGYRSDDPDPVTAAGSDETEGYVLLSVHNSYSQDDWVRWGNATQTRGSDMKGHELRFAWAFSAHMNLAFRRFLAEAITSIEDGKRFRAGFNYRF